MPSRSLEQELAINVKDQNVVVFASAGAGKTFTLIERLIKRIIIDKLNLDEIIAMTFTEAAADNMKYKLEAKINEKILENPEDEHLKKQLELIDTAKISTIHSFCLSLIKEYYYLLGIQKARIENILNEADKQLLLEEAFDDTLENFKDTPFLLNKVSDSILTKDRLKETITLIFNKVIAYANPDKSLNDLKQTKIKDLNDLNPKIMTYYLNDLKSDILQCLTYSDLIKTNDYYQGLSEFFKQLLQANDYETFLDLITTTPLILPTIKKTDECSEYRDKITETLKKLSAKLVDIKDIINTHNESLKYLNSLIEFTEMYLHKYNQLKTEHNVLDFNDFEHFAYQLLLMNNHQLADKFKNKYQEIMIDEFQDTNDVQYEIAKLISNNNLFVVGDIKQSIYGFRNAKPQIMKSLLVDPNFKQVHLKANYRSQKSIVDFNNELYFKIMNIFENSYPEIDIQEAFKKADNDFVELLLADSDSFDQYDLIANKIRELIDQGLALKDIAILVKTHDKKILLKQALDKYNIPSFFIDRQNYLSSKSLDVILAYLKYLYDNNDLISKVAILSSALYQLSDDDLIKIKDQNFDYQKLTNDVEELNKLLKENKILEIIYYILNINDYYYYLDKVDQANIDLFILEYSNNEYHSLSEMLRYIDNIKDIRSDSASAVSMDDDVIKIMTIHTSKGLDFSHVFVLSESKNQYQENSDNIHIDSELSIGCSYLINDFNQAKDNITNLAIKAKNNKESLNEYLRLFYVATTRAINKLYIVDKYQDFKTRVHDENLLYSRKGFTSYLFDLEHLLTKRVSSLKDYEPLKAQEEKSNITYKKHYDFELINAYKPSTHLKTKLLYKENFEFGTRVHEFFEHLDLFNPNINAEEIINNYSKNIYEAIVYYLDSDIIKEVKKGTIYPEYEFFIQEDNQNIHGFMDLVSIQEDKIILIDYKTNTNVTIDDLKSLYSNQMTVYKKALSSNYKQEIKAYLYSTYLKQFIEIN